MSTFDAFFYGFTAGGLTMCLSMGQLTTDRALVDEAVLPMNVLLTPKNTPAYLMREAIEWCCDHYCPPERVRLHNHGDDFWTVRCDWEGSTCFLDTNLLADGSVVFSETAASSHR